MDSRSKREKLRAMAKQKESPNEAAVAQRKLDEMGPEPPPPVVKSYNVVYINGKAHVFSGEYSDYVSSGVRMNFNLWGNATRGNSPKK